MNPEEQTVTWLISLGVLSSPKKNIADPEDFLKTSLKDGVVLCKLAERLIPGFTPKVSCWLISQLRPTNAKRSTALGERKGGVWFNWYRQELLPEAGLSVLYPPPHHFEPRSFNNSSFACCEMHQITAVFGVLSDAGFHYAVSCEARKLFRILHLSELVLTTTKTGHIRQGKSAWIIERTPYWLRSSEGLPNDVQLFNNFYWR